MTLNYCHLSQHPSDMSDQALAHELGDLPDSEVMRSLLMAEIDAIRAGADREQRTLRGLWYNLVKPALSRAGLLNALTRNGKPKDWDGNLSRYLAELVREGVTTYEELLIVDGSRQRATASEVTKSIVDVGLVGAHFPWAILFTEKDTIWPIVRDLARLYGVSAVSGSGKPSCACTENLVKAILQSPAYQETEPESFVLLALTDYDPSGYIISRAQHTQIQEVLEGLEHANGANLPPVAYQRIGLEPGQLTREEVMANAYEPTGTRKELRDWLAETGGIGGELLGLELDALSLSKLRTMFTEAIEGAVDLDARRDDLRQAFVDLLACELLLPEFTRKRQALLDAVWSDRGLARGIIDTPLPDSLFSSAALAGWASIDPLATRYNGGPLFDQADQVRAAMRERLAELGA